MNKIFLICEIYTFLTVIKSATIGNGGDFHFPDDNVAVRPTFTPENIQCKCWEIKKRMF